MTDIRIELSSDTQTRPGPEMRRAMAEAPVGDEQRGEDPSVNRLCAMTAELLGKEDALFLPSGTMCNQVSFLVHCRAGDEILADRIYHVITREAGGAAALAGAMICALDGKNGVITAEQVEAAVREPRRDAPRTRVVTVEQTINFASGAVFPLPVIREIAAVARRHGLAMHMDGARLLNAVVASGVPARDYAEPFESVWIDLSKSLGCPVGAVLAGSADFVREAWRWKQCLGGAMRQAGILAAAGCYALKHHVDRLAEDHVNARLFAERIARINGIRLDLDSVQTNIVVFDVRDTGIDAAEVVKRLMALGIRIDRLAPYALRVVTHLDVDRARVEEAAESLARVVRA